MQSVREQVSTRRFSLFRLATAALLAVATLATPAFAQRRREVDEKQLADIKAKYTKYEYRIPMRDGKRLFTAVYVPKDDSHKYPIMLKRTPYSVAPYGADEYRDRLGPSKLFDKSGYIFVLQDVRGRMMSEGEYVNMRPYIADKKKPTDIDESSDTYDTIDWLIKHVPNHNGKVGQWGISYPGFYTVTGMIDAHPALEAASPQAPVTDWFIGDDWHHNGALQIAHMLNFLPFFDRPRPEPIKKFDTTFDYETPDGYDLFLHFGPLSKASDKYFKGETAYLNEVCQHGNYDDWWKARNIRAAHQRHQAGRDDRRRLVRRREPVRRTRGLSQAPQKLARDRQSHRDGPVGARRVVPRRRIEARRRAIQRPDGRVLSARRSSSRSSSTTSRAKIRQVRASRRPGSSRRGPTFGGSTRAGRRSRLSRARTTLPRDGKLSSVSAFAVGRRSRRVRQRPVATGPLSGDDHHAHDPGVHDGRPAVRLATSRRAGLRDRSAGRRRDRSPVRSRSTSTSRRRGPTRTGSSS